MPDAPCPLITVFWMHKEEFDRPFEGLSRRRKQVLELFLAGKTDSEIALSLYITESTVRKHIENICDRFVLHQDTLDNRRSRRSDLIALFAQYKPELIGGNTRASVPAVSSKMTAGVEAAATKSEQRPEQRPVTRQDWGEAPDISDFFYGRDRELATLQQWIFEDGCRAIAVFGMAGMGKTALCTLLAEQIKDRFECLIWRNLRHTPPVGDLLAELIGFLSNLPQADLAAKTSDRIKQLMECLKKQQCLIVLDGVESILQDSDYAGQYPQGYEEFGELLQRIGSERHQSCLLLNGWDKPREIALLEGRVSAASAQRNRRVRSLQLDGLGAAARKIFQEQGLSDEEEWDALIDIYRGNPLALQIVSARIKELCNGSVAQYFDFGTLILDKHFQQLLHQHYQRLSELEKQIMRSLASHRQPIALPQLLAQMNSVSASEAIEALNSLGWRALIEKIPQGNESLFTLQPVVMKYVTREHL
ncbi:MAG: AAA family ATPase [Oscillatoria sp. SIO1A7]|nr:AAA family ATPase [Oscillatoria sp. SIO1A7]